jgi:hypothetical protein
MRPFPLTPGPQPGEVAEWSIAPDSKSGSRVSRDEGSNPSLSASTTPMPRRLTACLAAAALAAGCVTRSEDVKPLAADPAAFASMDCAALYDEADRVSVAAARLAYAVDERLGTNLVALGVGATVFWPALLAMRAPGPDSDALARLKGRDEALRAAQAARGCPPAPSALPPERAAQLPVAVGERLVYEERAAAGGPPRELVLRLTALRRGEIEFTVDAPRAAAGTRWQQDRFGNLPQPPLDGWVHWRRLLQPDLVLGSVLAGEIGGGSSDGAQRGRVRGQVIALGVQTTLGRPFDAAVIELFGDVPLGEHSTRLDGVMVVDRKSGVLLRLDLKSGNPDFALRRVLVRIEPAG